MGPGLTAQQAHKNGNSVSPTPDPEEAGNQEWRGQDGRPEELTLCSALRGQHTGPVKDGEERQA